MQDFLQDLCFPACLLPCPQPALEAQTFSQATLQTPLPRAPHACHGAMSTALLPHSLARAPWQRLSTELCPCRCQRPSDGLLAFEPNRDRARGTGV